MNLQQHHLPVTGLVEYTERQARDGGVGVWCVSCLVCVECRWCGVCDVVCGVWGVWGVDVCVVFGECGVFGV